MVNNNKTLALIEKALKGDQTAYSKLLDSHWKEVYSFQMKRTNDENEAEDITIQAFSKAFDKLDTYKPEFQFNTWIITIARNLHIDLLRKKERADKKMVRSTVREVREVESEDPSPETRVIREQNLKALLELIKKLKPDYQEMIQLRFFQELSYKEIAQHTNQPMNNVKVKLLRAKKLLASLIDQKEKR